MTFFRFASSAALVVAAGFASAAALAADVTVRLLHVDPNPGVGVFYNEVARRFEASHPGVKVEINYLEGDAYKKKLTTLLQSPDRPNILYSYGGGVLREQVKAGVVEDLTAPMNAGWKDRFLPAAVQNYNLGGHIYGVPFLVSQVGFFYNKELFAKAGVDGASIKTWDDLLAGVRKLQAAGITPIIAAGSDKWPLQFYWSHLAVRIGGKPAFEAALRGDGKGFGNDTFVRAGEMLKQLGDMKPFQPGYLATTYPQSTGQFGDGKGAMMLTFNMLLGAMRANSADKQGIPADKLGWMPFPTVAGGKGDPSDTMGGMIGWIVTKGSPKEAVEFLNYFSEAQNQRIAAERGLYLPVVNGTQEALTNPLLRSLVDNVGRSRYHQTYYDHNLGPSVGAVVNDVSTDLASGRMKPADAAAAVQAAWQRASSN
jgi:raffinose/stachyose/melibiose transport system substrate-binding protein